MDQYTLFTIGEFFHGEGHRAIPFGSTVGKVVNGNFSRIHLTGDPDPPDGVAILSAPPDVKGLNRTGQYPMSGAHKFDTGIVLGVIPQYERNFPGTLFQGTNSIFFQHSGHIFRKKHLDIISQSALGGNGFLFQKILQSGSLFSSGKPAVESAEPLLRQKQHGTRFVIVAHDAHDST